MSATPIVIATDTRGPTMKRCLSVSPPGWIALALTLAGFRDRARDRVFSWTGKEIPS